MKKVILKSLTLTNWRGERNRTTQFDPISTTISGGNGLGKSRHFDAFMWLLFGKDREDRKDFNVKTVIDGEELHKADAVVEALLRVDDQELRLKRVLTEEWVKPRGQVEEVFRGNKTECYWNDAPVSVGEYGKRVRELIDDTLFKMITNPYHFVSLGWREQREQLFAMAGALTDEEIANGNEEFGLLLDRLSGKSFDDFRKELSGRKRRLRDALAEIQPRIDQVRKMMPQEEDFTALEEEKSRIEAEVKEIDSQLSELDEALTDINKAISRQSEERRKRAEHLNALKSRCQRLVHQAEASEAERVHLANSELRELRREVETREKELAYRQADVRTALLKIANLRRDIRLMTAEQDRLRQEWYTESGKKWEGETTCHHCHQSLPAEMIDRSKSIFVESVAEVCDEISRRGRELKEKIDEANAALSHIESEEMQTLTLSTGKLKAELAELKATLASKHEETPRKVDPQSIEAWVNIQEEIKAVESQEVPQRGGEDAAPIKEQKQILCSRRNELTEQKSEIQNRLGVKVSIERAEGEIASLEAQGKELAQQLADAERQEYVMAAFNRKRITECESRINALFRHVTFRLFDYTIEDSAKENPVETCIPLVNGVPFAVANTADQVNAGLDIINALCRFYGVTAPIFIDGRESVNEIIPTESQVINLVVTNDKELIIR